MRVSRPERCKFRPVANHDENGLIDDPWDNLADAVAHGRIDPMGILDDEYNGPAPAQGHHLVNQRLDGSMAQLLRRQVETAKAIFCWNRQQGRKERHDRFEVSFDRQQHRLQLVEPGLVAVVIRDACSASHSLDDGIKRTFGMMGGTLVVEVVTLLRIDRFLEVLQHSGFADSGFA